MSIMLAKKLFMVNGFGQSFEKMLKNLKKYATGTKKEGLLSKWLPVFAKSGHVATASLEP